MTCTAMTIRAQLLSLLSFLISREDWFDQIRKCGTHEILTRALSVYAKNLNAVFQPCRNKDQKSLGAIAME